MVIKVDNGFKWGLVKLINTCFHYSIKRKVKQQVLRSAFVLTE